MKLICPHDGSMTCKIRLQKSLLIKALLFAIFSTMCCSREKSDSDLQIVARVGDRLITVEEFIERAELTPRQPYCSSNTPRDKAIVLNTLIAEKLFALEAQDDPVLLQNERFFSYLRGRKEQYMRELLFRDKALGKVSLDTSDIVNYYEFAGREYTLEYYNLDSVQAGKLQQKFEEQPGLKSALFDDISLTETPPVKKISWEDQETPDNLHLALYSEPLNRNDVIGPIRFDCDRYLVVKIVDWKDSKALGGQQARTRWKDVENKLAEIQANRLWADYTGELMSGKSLVFNKNVCIRLFQIFESWLRETERMKAADLRSAVSEMDEQDFSFSSADEEFLKEPFCKIDDEVWTVDDIKKAVMSHPLVFRKREINGRDELFDQFKLAIADLIKDHYINLEAYKRGYDRRADVRRYVQKWQDAHAAVYVRDKLLRELSFRDDFDRRRLKGRDTYLDVYLDSLKTLYERDIDIYLSRLDEIRLTSAPMYAVKPTQPFLLPTPVFPLLTDDDGLDYGHTHP